MFSSSAELTLSTVPASPKAVTGIKMVAVGAEEAEEEAEA